MINKELTHDITVLINNHHGWQYSIHQDLSDDQKDYWRGEYYKSLSTLYEKYGIDLPSRQFAMDYLELEEYYKK